MSWKDVLHVARRDPDSNDRAQADNDVDDELLFHLRSLVDDNMTRGMSHEEAWNDAQKRFGSLRRYWVQCRRATLAHGPRLFGLLAGGAIALGLLVGWLVLGTWSVGRQQQAARSAAETSQTLPRTPARPAADQSEPGDRQAWAKKLAGLAEGNWRRAASAGQALAALPPEEGYAILEENWIRIDSVDARQQMLKAWIFAMPYPLQARNHPRLLDVLNLGMHDVPAVQGWSLGYLRSIALRDFSEDFTEYETWYAANRTKPLPQIAVESTRQFVASAAQVRGMERTQLTLLANDARSLFRDKPDARAAAIDAGLVKTIEQWTAAAMAAGADREDVETAQFGLRLLAALELPEAELRRVVVPLVSKKTPQKIRTAAISALEREEFAWAIPLLVDALRQAVAEGDPGSKSVIWTAAGALAEIGDPAAIPPMIAVIESDDTYDTIYGVGYFGLGKLTGVPYDEKHDGAWWRAWWAKNKERYPDVSDAQVPAPRKVPAKEASYRARSDVADVPAQDLRAGDDPKKRYFLIGQADKDQAPEEGYKLLFVLPGGDGSAEYHSFVQRIYKNVLDKNWLIAEPVAPEWDKKQLERITWPTAKSRYPAAKFTTEALIAAILTDVRSKVKLDPRYIFMLGWSSGGPPVYATTVTRKSPIVGAFVAMSIFVPSQTPALEGGKGKAFYLLQSPDDQVTTIFFAERAEKALQAAGAKVKLERYPGGHGWQGNVYDMLRDGITWLEENAPGAN